MSISRSAVSASRLTSREYDYLLAQLRVRRRKRQLWFGMIVFGAATLLFIAVLCFSGGAPWYGIYHLIAFIGLSVKASERTDLLERQVPAEPTFELYRVEGPYRWLAVTDRGTTNAIGGAQFGIPTHWRRYLEAGESLQARVAVTEHEEKLYGLSLKKGLSIDREMDMGLTQLPEFFPHWTTIGGLGVFGGGLGLLLAWLLEVPQWMVVSAAVAGLSLLLVGGFWGNRWRFLAHIDEHYWTKHHLDPMSWWNHRQEKESVTAQEAVEMLTEDGKRSTERPLR